MQHCLSENESASVNCWNAGWFGGSNTAPNVGNFRSRKESDEGERFFAGIQARDVGHFRGIKQTCKV
jgi:hypothetical protein